MARISPRPRETITFPPTPPSPTMQALKIGSVFSSKSLYARRIQPLELVVSKSAIDEESYEELQLDYESNDDLDPEPALTSDAATAPSSSHPSSPSLSPVDESPHVDIMSSSPIRDSFFRPYPRRYTLDEKPGTREDVAAALLALALPRFGVSPHVSHVAPSSASCPEPSSAGRVAIPIMPTLTEHVAVLEDREPREQFAGLEHLVQPASIDAPVEDCQTETATALRSSNSTESSGSLSDDCTLIRPDDPQEPSVSNLVTLPPRALSPLPPSSPYPDDPEDLGEVTTGNQCRLSPSRALSPLSCLSSPPPSPSRPTLDTFEVLNELSSDPMTSALIEAYSSPAPEQEASSPLSSPPASPRISAIDIHENALGLEIPSSAPVVVPQKRKRTIGTSNEGGDEVVSDGLASDDAVAESLRRPRKVAHTQAPQARNPGASRKRKVPTARVRDGARASSADPSTSSSADRSDTACPHPSIPSLIVEAFALSRATSLGSSALYDAISSSYPALADEGAISPLSTLAIDAVLAWGTERGLFEALPSSGEGVPPTYFYMPAADWDKDRADLYTALGGRGARTVKRAYKQYYWKPVTLPRSNARARRSADEDIKRSWDSDWEG